MLAYEQQLGGMAPPTPPNGDDQQHFDPNHSRIPLSDKTNVTSAVHKEHVKQDVKHTHIWLVSGPAGCGKSTVAEFVAKTLNVPYLEGDEFHPQANIDKMAKGIPLSDEDRWDWLIQLRDEAVQKLNEGSQGVVVTCSALKRKYRDVMRVAQYYQHDVQLHFIYLHATEEVLLQRVGARQGHYMGANMVKSQLSALEPPQEDEVDVTAVDVSGTKEEVELEALKGIKALLNES